MDAQATQGPTAGHAAPPRHPQRHCGYCSDGYYLRSPSRSGWRRAPSLDDTEEFGLCEAWITSGGAVYMAPVGHALLLRQMCNCLRTFNGYRQLQLANQSAA